MLTLTDGWMLKKKRSFINMDDKKFKELIAWIQQQIAATPFGEVSVKLILHENQVKRIEKVISCREIG